MKADLIKQTLKVCLQNNFNVLIKGAPGVGKSDIVEQAVLELKYDQLVCHPVVDDPTDYKGLPGNVNGVAEFLPYGNLRKMMEAKKPLVVFFDDLGQAPACVQAACMQLLLARAINGKPISKHVRFVAATNRRADKAGVHSILEPVKSRFAAILELEAEIVSWSEWAFDNNMPDELVAFLNFRPDLLHNFKATSDIVNSPCPRTWANLGKLYQAGLTDSEVLAGAVGEGGAVEFLGFTNVYNQLPSIQGILMDPNSEDVPVNPAATYAVCCALIKRATVDNGERIFTYASRLSAEFSVFLVRGLTRKVAALKKTMAYIKWADQHQDVL